MTTNRGTVKLDAERYTLAASFRTGARIYTGSASLEALEHLGAIMLDSDAYNGVSIWGDQGTRIRLSRDMVKAHAGAASDAAQG